MIFIKKKKNQRAYDLTNQPFGDLIALDTNKQDSGRHNIWRCSCKCGNEVEFTATDLIVNGKTSCGKCGSKTPLKTDLDYSDKTVAVVGKNQSGGDTGTFQCISDVVFNNTSDSIGLKVIEEKRDLLSVPPYYHIAHTISADLAFGKGLAKKIDTYWDMKKRLLETYGIWDEILCGKTYDVGNIFNLVIKEKKYDTASIDELESCLDDLCNLIFLYDIKYLAIPKLGCGGEHFDWAEVKPLILEVLADCDLTLLICDFE